MKYNYQLVMNIFICERNPNATLADGFLLTGQTTVYELGGGGRKGLNACVDITVFVQPLSLKLDIFK